MQASLQDHISLSLNKEHASHYFPSIIMLPHNDKVNVKEKGR